MRFGSFLFAFHGKHTDVPGKNSLLPWETCYWHRTGQAQTALCVIIGHLEGQTKPYFVGEADSMVSYGTLW